MYIKSIAIYESFPEIKEIRKVNFKLGANFIVDNGGTDQKGNNLGKTTVLRIIDICLGSQDRKYIYTDDELGIVNESLENYITNNKIFAEMIIQDSLNEDEVQEKHVLKVDLYQNGKRFIDEERYNLLDYFGEMNKIFFRNEITKPTFRQLLGMFVRINVKDDNTRFLKFLDSHTSSAQYDNVYSYLFRLGNPESNERLLELKETLKTVSGNLKQLFNMNRIKSIDAIEQRVYELKTEIETVRRNITSIVDVDALKRNEEEVGLARSKYSALIDEIDTYKFKLERVQETLKFARDEQKREIDNKALASLYADIKYEISSIAKTFDELVIFNTQLLNNKISFFEKQEATFTDSIKELESKKDDLFTQYKDVVTLIKNNDMDSYVTLQSRFEELAREQGKFVKIVELNTQLSKQIKDIDAEIESTEAATNTDPNEKLLLFNKFFTPYSESINEEAYYLYKKSTGFPMGIDNKSSTTSTGAKKSAIAAFDLAYQSYAKENNIHSPRFVIHDVIETMDSVSFKNTIRLSNEIGSQYIAAVLRDKLVGIEDGTPSNIRLTLKKDDKFFRM